MNFNRLWFKTSHGFVDQSDVNIFRGPIWIFFPVTACHWQVLKLNLTSHFIGFLTRTHVGAKQIFITFSVH